MAVFCFVEFRVFAKGVYIAVVSFFSSSVFFVTGVFLFFFCVFSCCLFRLWRLYDRFVLLVFFLVFFKEKDAIRAPFCFGGFGIVYRRQDETLLTTIS